MENKEYKQLSDEQMKDVAGGSDLRDFPHYDQVKAFYKERGAGDAVNLCGIYGLNTEDSYAMVSMIAGEVAREAEQMAGNNISF